MEKTIIRGAKELSKYTGLSRNAVHIMVRRGILPVRRCGRRRLVFIKEDIDQFFRRLPGTSTADALLALEATTEVATTPCPPRTGGVGAQQKRGQWE